MEIPLLSSSSKDIGSGPQRFMIYTVRYKLCVSIDKHTINNKEWHHATKPLKKGVTI
jgi:hypothetical protein